MKRKLIENTVYNGQITPKTSFSDAVNMAINQKYKNPLFSFLFAIDADNMKNSFIKREFMPNDIYVLNEGYIWCGRVEDKEIKTKIEDEEPIMDSWVYIKKDGVNCLAMMFKRLIDHLNRCQIEPFSISEYMLDKEDFGIKLIDVEAFEFKK